MKDKISEIMNLIPDLGGQLDFLSVLSIQASDEIMNLCEEIRHEICEAEKAALDSDWFEPAGIVTGLGTDEDEDLL